VITKAQDEHGGLCEARVSPAEAFASPTAASQRHQNVFAPDGKYASLLTGNDSVFIAVINQP